MVVIAVRAAVIVDPLPSASVASGNLLPFVGPESHLVAPLKTPVAPFMGRCSDAHATGDAQGGQNGRQNGDYRLNDEFPSFFFHGIRLG